MATTADIIANLKINVDKSEVEQTSADTAQRLSTVENILNEMNGYTSVSEFMTFLSGNGLENAFSQMIGGMNSLVSGFRTMNSEAIKSSGILSDSYAAAYKEMAMTSIGLQKNMKSIIKSFDMSRQGKSYSLKEDLYSDMISTSTQAEVAKLNADAIKQMRDSMTVTVGNVLKDSSAMLIPEINSAVKNLNTQSKARRSARELSEYIWKNNPSISNMIHRVSPGIQDSEAQTAIEYLIRSRGNALAFSDYDYMYKANKSRSPKAYSVDDVLPEPFRDSFRRIVYNQAGTEHWSPIGQDVQKDVWDRVIKYANQSKQSGMIDKILAEVGAVHYDKNSKSYDATLSLETANQLTYLLLQRFARSKRSIFGFEKEDILDPSISPNVVNHQNKEQRAITDVLNILAEDYDIEPINYFDYQHVPVLTRTSIPRSRAAKGFKVPNKLSRYSIKGGSNQRYSKARVYNGYPDFYFIPQTKLDGNGNLIYRDPEDFHPDKDYFQEGGQKDSSYITIGESSLTRDLGFHGRGTLGRGWDGDNRIIRPKEAATKRYDQYVAWDISDAFLFDEETNRPVYNHSLDNYLDFFAGRSTISYGPEGDKHNYVYSHTNGTQVFMLEEDEYKKLVAKDAGIADPNSVVLGKDYGPTRFTMWDINGGIYSDYEKTNKINEGIRRNTTPTISFTERGFSQQDVDNFRYAAVNLDVLYDALGIPKNGDSGYSSRIDGPILMNPNMFAKSGGNFAAQLRMAGNAIKGVGHTIDINKLLELSTLLNYVNPDNLLYDTKSLYLPSTATEEEVRMLLTSRDSNGNRIDKQTLLRLRDEKFQNALSNAVDMIITDSAIKPAGQFKYLDEETYKRIFKGRPIDPNRVISEETYVDETGDSGEKTAEEIRNSTRKIIRLTAEERNEYMTYAIKKAGGPGIVEDSDQFESMKDFIPYSIYKSMGSPEELQRESDKNYRDYFKSLNYGYGIRKHVIAGNRDLETRLEQEGDSFLFSKEVQSLVEQERKKMHDRQFNNNLYLPNHGVYTGLAVESPSAWLELFYQMVTGESANTTGENGENPFKLIRNQVSSEMVKLLDQEKNGSIFAPGANKYNLKRVISERFPAAMGTGRVRTIDNANNLLLNTLRYADNVIALTPNQQYQHNTGDFDGDTVQLYFGLNDMLLDTIDTRNKDIDAARERLRSVFKPKSAKRATKAYNAFGNDAESRNKGQMRIENPFNFLLAQASMGLTSSALSWAEEMPDSVEKYMAIAKAMEAYDKASTMQKTGDVVALDAALKELVGQGRLEERIKKELIAVTNNPNRARDAKSIFSWRPRSFKNAFAVQDILASQRLGRGSDLNFAERMDDIFNFSAEQFGENSLLKEAANWFGTSYLGHVSGLRFIGKEDIERGEKYYQDLMQQATGFLANGDRDRANNVKFHASKLFTFLSNARENTSIEAGEQAIKELGRAMSLTNDTQTLEALNNQQKDLVEAFMFTGQLSEEMRDLRLKTVEDFMLNNPNLDFGKLNKERTALKGYDPNDPSKTSELFQERYLARVQEFEAERKALEEEAKKLREQYGVMEYGDLTDEYVKLLPKARRNIRNVAGNNVTAIEKYMDKSQVGQVGYYGTLGKDTFDSSLAGNGERIQFSKHLGNTDEQIEQRQRELLLSLYNLHPTKELEPYLNTDTDFTRIGTVVHSAIEDYVHAIIEGNADQLGTLGEHLVRKIQTGTVKRRNFKGKEEDIAAAQFLADLGGMGIELVDKGASAKGERYSLRTSNDTIADRFRHLLYDASGTMNKGTLSFIEDFLKNGEKVVQAEDQILDSSNKWVGAKRVYNFENGVDANGDPIDRSNYKGVMAKPDYVTERDESGQKKYTIIDWKSSIEGASDSTLQSSVYAAMLDKFAEEDLKKGLTNSPYARYGYLDQNGDYVSRIDRTVGVDYNTGKFVVKQLDKAEKDAAWNTYQTAVDTKNFSLLNLDEKEVAGVMSIIETLESSRKFIDKIDKDWAKKSSDNFMSNFLADEYSRALEDIENLRSTFYKRDKRLNNTDSSYMSEYSRYREQLNPEKTGLVFSKMLARAKGTAEEEAIRAAIADASHQLFDIDSKLKDQQIDYVSKGYNDFKSGLARNVYGIKENSAIQAVRQLTNARLQYISEVEDLINNPEYYSVDSNGRGHWLTTEDQNATDKVAESKRAIRAGKAQSAYREGLTNISDLEGNIADWSSALLGQAATSNKSEFSDIMKTFGHEEDVQEKLSDYYENYYNKILGQIETERQFIDQIDKTLKAKRNDGSWVIQDDATRSRLENLIKEANLRRDAMQAELANDAGLTKVAERELSHNKANEEYKQFEQTSQISKINHSADLEDRKISRQARAYREQFQMSRFSRAYAQERNFRESLADQISEKQYQRIQLEQRRNIIAKLRDTSVGDEKEKYSKQYDVLDAQMRSVMRSENDLTKLYNETNKVPIALMSAFKTIGPVITQMTARIFRQAIQTAKQFVIQFDKSMTEIQMVTLKTDSEMSKLGDGLISKAVELKASIADITKAATALYRQGLNDQQVDERLDSIIKFSRVSGVSADNATKLATVVANAGLFDSVSDAFDVVSLVSDSAATNPDTITKAIQRSAYSAKAAGIDGNELTALISAISSKTQLSGAVVGTSLSNIFSRLKRISANEIVYDDQGRATTSSNVQKALNSAGIDLYENGHARNTIHILRDIANWKNANPDNSAVYDAISYAISGTGRQASNFQALIDSLAEVDENGETVIDMFLRLADAAEGTVDRKNEAYMNSLAASMNNVKTSFEQLVESLTDSVPFEGALDLFAGLIQGLTTWMELGNGAVGQVVSFTAALGGLASVLALLSFNPIVAGVTAGAAAFGAVGFGIKKISESPLVEDVYTKNARRLEEVNKAQSYLDTAVELNNKQLNGESLDTKETNKFISVFDSLVDFGALKESEKEAVFAIDDLGERSKKAAEALEEAAVKIKDQNRNVAISNFNEDIKQRDARYSEWAKSANFSDITEKDVASGFLYMLGFNDETNKQSQRALVSSMFNAGLIKPQYKNDKAENYFDSNSDTAFMNMINPYSDSTSKALFDYYEALGEEMPDVSKMSKKEYEDYYDQLLARTGYVDMLGAIRFAYDKNPNNFNPLNYVSSVITGNVGETKTDFAESQRAEFEKFIASELPDDFVNEGFTREELAKSYVDLLYSQYAGDAQGSDKFLEIRKPILNYDDEFDQEKFNRHFGNRTYEIKQNAKRLREENRTRAYTTLSSTLDAAISNAYASSNLSNFRSARDSLREYSDWMADNDRRTRKTTRSQDRLADLANTSFKGLLEGENADEMTIRRFKDIQTKLDEGTLTQKDLDDFYDYLNSKVSEFEFYVDAFQQADRLIENFNNLITNGFIYSDSVLNEAAKQEISKIVGTDMAANPENFEGTLSMDLANLQLRSSAFGISATLSNDQIASEAERISNNLVSAESPEGLISAWSGVSESMRQYLYQNVPALKKLNEALLNGNIDTSKYEKDLAAEIEKLRTSYEGLSDKSLEYVAGLSSVLLSDRSKTNQTMVSDIRTGNRLKELSKKMGENASNLASFEIEEIANALNVDANTISDAINAGDSSCYSDLLYNVANESMNAVLSAYQQKIVTALAEINESLIPNMDTATIKGALLQSGNTELAQYVENAGLYTDENGYLKSDKTSARSASEMYKDYRRNNNLEQYESMADYLEFYITAYGMSRDEAINRLYNEHRDVLETLGHNDMDIAAGLDDETKRLAAFNKIVSPGGKAYLSNRSRQQTYAEAISQYTSALDTDDFSDDKVTAIATYLTDIAGLRNVEAASDEDQIIREMLASRIYGREASYNPAILRKLLEFASNEDSQSLLDYYMSFQTDDAKDVLNTLTGFNIESLSVETDPDKIENYMDDAYSALLNALFVSTGLTDAKTWSTAIQNRNDNPSNYYETVQSARQQASNYALVQRAMNTRGTYASDQILKTVFGLDDSQLKNDKFVQERWEAFRDSLRKTVDGLLNANGLELEDISNMDQLPESVRDFLELVGIEIENGAIDIDTSILTDSIQNIIDNTAKELTNNSNLVNFMKILEIYENSDQTTLASNMQAAMESGELPKEFLERNSEFNNLMTLATQGIAVDAQKIYSQARGNYDLSNPRWHDPQDAINAGWGVDDPDLAKSDIQSLYSTSYGGRFNEGDKVIGLTPFALDGSTLTKKELDEYMDKLESFGSYEDAFAFDKNNGKRLIVDTVDVQDGNWDAANAEMYSRLSSYHLLHEQEWSGSNEMLDQLFAALGNYIQKSALGTFGQSMEDFNPWLRFLTGSDASSISDLSFESLQANASMLAEENPILFEMSMDMVSKIEGATEALTNLRKVMAGEKIDARAAKDSTDKLKNSVANFAAESENTGRKAFERMNADLETLREGGEDAVRVIGKMTDRVQQFNDKKNALNEYIKGSKKSTVLSDLSNLIGVSENTLKQAKGEEKQNYINMGKVAIGYEDVTISQDFGIMAEQAINYAREELLKIDPNFELDPFIGVGGTFNIEEFLKMVDKLGASVAEPIRALFASWTNLGGTIAIDLDEDGRAIVKASTGSMGSYRSSRSGGSGSKGKSDAEKLVDRLKKGQELYDHRIKMYQYEETRYQNLDQLRNYGSVLQKEIDIEKAYLPVLNENIDALKRQLDATETGTDDWYTVREALLAAEEKYADITNTIDENTKKLRENQKAILQTHTTLEDMVKQEIENRIQRQRDMLAGNVSMQDTILDAVKARYQKEWQLIKDDIDQKKKALEEEKALIDERLNKRKSAEDEAQKYERLAELKRQYAMVSMDSSRTKDAANLRKQISDLEKEIGWDIADQEAQAMSDAIQSQIDAYDEFASTGDEDLDKLLEDANNFGVEVKNILGMSHDDLMAWLSSNDDSYRNSLSLSQQKIMQDWEDTWKQMYGIVDTYWAQIDEILSSEDSFTRYMTQSIDYTTASLDAQRIKMLEWAEAYEKYLKVSILDENYFHKDTGLGDEYGSERVFKNGGSGSSSGGSGGGSGGGNANSKISDTTGSTNERKWDYGTASTFSWEPSKNGSGGNRYVSYTNTTTGETKNFHGYTLEEANEQIKKLKETDAYKNGWLTNLSIGYSSVVEADSSPVNSAAQNASAPQTTTTKGTATVSANGSARLRSGPGTDYSQVGTIGAGQTLTITGKSGNWYNTNKGWISGNLLKNIKTYDKGGLADFTGVIQIDGTKKDPERILNAHQTKSFDRLVDIMDNGIVNSLENVFSEMDHWSTFAAVTPTVPYFDIPEVSETTQTIGDIYVTLNEAKLESDADYAEVADRVGRLFKKELSKRGFTSMNY